MIRSRAIRRNGFTENDKVRKVLDPLGAMTERLNVATICNNHHTKGSGGTSANNKVIGSVAFVNQARTVVSVLVDAEHEVAACSFRLK